MSALVDASYHRGVILQGSSMLDLFNPCLQPSSLASFVALLLSNWMVIKARQYSMKLGVETWSNAIDLQEQVNARIQARLTPACLLTHC